MPVSHHAGVCEDLPDPTSGTVSISDSSRLSGTLATYTCNAGYMLSGDAQRTCQASGMWSGTAPVCNLGIIFCTIQSLHVIGKL